MWRVEKRDLVESGAPLLDRTSGRKANVVLMAPNRLMSTMLEKSWMELHSISAHCNIPALLTTAHRPEEEITAEGGAPQTSKPSRLILPGSPEPAHFLQHAKLTFLRQVLQNFHLRLLHVSVAAHVQFEHLQVAGALGGEALSTVSIWKQAASKDHKAPLVQPASQMEAEAAVAASNQHAAPTPIHMVVLLTGYWLGDDDQQNYHGQAADGSQQEDCTHAATGGATGGTTGGATGGAAAQLIGLNESSSHSFCSGTTTAALVSEGKLPSKFPRKGFFLNQHEEKKFSKKFRPN